MGNKQPIIEQQNEFELKEKDKKYLLEYLQQDNFDLFKIICNNYDISDILKCKNEQGESLLQQSLYSTPNLKIFEFLFHLNCDLEHLDLEGNSVLHTAVKLNSIPAVSLIVRKLPHQLHQPNNTDLIPLELAQKLKHEDIVLILKLEHLMKLSSSKEFQHEVIDWNGFFPTIPFIKPSEIIPDSDIIGSGAQSHIQAAHLKSNLETKVALKISRRCVFFRSLFREIELLSQEFIKHPNIIPILGFTVIPGVSIGILYPFSELGDLEKIIQPGGYLLSEHQCNHLIIGIAKGLQHLHRYHIIHNDLKPKNIVLFRNEEDYVLFDPKLIDFGITFVDETQKPEELAQSYEITPQKSLGTDIYAAPERPDHPSYQSDIYSFGVTCWQICNQKKPTAENLILENANPIIYDRFSKPLINLIYQCLSIDPQLRPNLEQFIP